MMEQRTGHMKKKVLKSKDLSKRLGLEEKVRQGVKRSQVDLVGERGAILNKKTLDAKAKAEEIIKEAQVEAKKIQSDAKDVLAQVEVELERERKRGYEEGREEGLSSVTEQVMAFEKMKEEFYVNAEENTIKLVMMVAEKVIGRTVHEHSDTIKSIVKQALESALGERIVIRLSPEDYKVISDAAFEFKDELDRTKRIQFKEDEAITQGGCIVETEVGTIDARLETQLKAIRKALEL